MSASAGTTHRSLQLIDLADASGSLTGTSRSKLDFATRGFRVPQSVLLCVGELALVHARESGEVFIERSYSRQSVRLDADSVAEVGHEISSAS